MYPENRWRLFNLNSDPTELYDVSNDHGEVVEELKEEYQSWADRVGVLPWDEVKDHQ